MSEHVSFSVDEDLRLLFSTDQDEFAAKLASEMEAALRGYPYFFRFDCDETRGEIKEDTISVEEIEIDEFGSGTAFYHFDEYLHMGCRDISGNTRHENDFPFKYDPDSGSVSIPFRELPERPTDDI